MTHTTRGKSICIHIKQKRFNKNISTDKDIYYTMIKRLRKNTAIINVFTSNGLPKRHEAKSENTKGLNRWQGSGWNFNFTNSVMDK